MRKSTKICRSYIQVDTVFCPYCGFEEDAPESFYKVKNEDDFQIVHTCASCGEEYRINWVKEM
jgi:RNase P subunit RPR2